MNLCPKCKSAQLRKDGFTTSGSQRYRCKACGARFTPNPQIPGYDEEVRLQAFQLHLEGHSLRKIGRVLNVNHQTVANWINDYTTFLPPELPHSIEELLEFDDFF